MWGLSSAAQQHPPSRTEDKLSSEDTLYCSVSPVTGTGDKDYGFEYFTTAVATSVTGDADYAFGYIFTTVGAIIVKRTMCLNLTTTAAITDDKEYAFDFYFFTTTVVVLQYQLM